MKKYILTVILLFSNYAFATRFNISQSEFEKLNSNSLFDSCNSIQKNELGTYSNELNISLNKNMKIWPNYNLMGVRKNYVETENREWIENNPKHFQYINYWNQMNKNLNLMLNDSNIGIKYACSSVSDKRCANGVIAYVAFLFNLPIKTIHVCPIFWNDNHDERLSTLFHELSHYSASTFDYAGDWWNGKDNIDVIKGSMDAYHLQEFYTASPDGVLKRMIWYWFWPKK